ncbi:MAG: hypothetical protein NT155_00945 [Candidatus Staskawiczbacteria bacterium]|nr:hypothetical protein [Candidatus Staskawiczbacteria bacterium]
MDTTIITNILFSVISIFLIFILAIFVILIAYTISILKNVLYFLEIIKNESKKIADDLESARDKIKGGEAIIISFVSSIISFLKNRGKRSKKNN